MPKIFSIGVIISRFGGLIGSFYRPSWSLNLLIDFRPCQGLAIVIKSLPDRRSRYGNVSSMKG